VKLLFSKQQHHRFSLHLSFTHITAIKTTVGMCDLNLWNQYYI